MTKVDIIRGRIEQLAAAGRLWGAELLAVRLRDLQECPRCGGQIRKELGRTTDHCTMRCACGFSVTVPAWDLHRNLVEGNGLLAACVAEERRKQQLPAPMAPTGAVRAERPAWPTGAAPKEALGAGAPAKARVATPRPAMAPSAPAAPVSEGASSARKGHEDAVHADRVAPGD
jgi:hypothetical protein